MIISNEAYKKLDEIEARKFFYTVVYSWTYVPKNHVHGIRTMHAQTLGEIQEQFKAWNAQNPDMWHYDITSISS